VRCEGLQVNVPVDDNFPTERAVFDSDLIPHAESEDCTMPVNNYTINPTKTSGATSCIEFFGEQPLSFRSLLKRYVKETDIVLAANAVATKICLNISQPIVPHINWEFGAGGPILNYFDYLRYAYLGMRGGIRRRMNIPFYTVHKGQQFHVSIYDETDTDNAQYDTQFTKLAPTVMGTVTFVPDVCGGVEFETPMYTNNLFLLSFNAFVVPSGSVFTQFTNNYAIISDNLGTQPATTYSPSIAAAEDFSFLRFQGAPYYSVST